MNRSDRDYEKAVDLLNKLEPKKENPEPKPEIKVKKPKKGIKRKVSYITAAIAIILIILFAFWLVMYLYEGYTEDVEEKELLIEEIKSLNATVDGATIEYGNHVQLKYRDNNWTTLNVEISFKDTPWEDYLAFFWYNTATQEYKIVSRE